MLLPRTGSAGEKLFSGLSLGSGILIVLLVLLVGGFLLYLALPALGQNQANFLTSREWQVTGAQLAFGISGMLWTTLLVSLTALVIAVPIAIGIALFLTQYLPKRVSGAFGFVVDLLAAVPSIIFGLWGAKVLAPFLYPAGEWLRNTLGCWGRAADGVCTRPGIPLFWDAPEGQGGGTGTVFVGAIVLAIMILPIITAISRDVFAQTPRDHQEAALALGATKWEMIRTTVLPYGRSGVVSASMLGLGRALGETVAIMIIISAPAPGSNWSPSLLVGGETFASKIAASAGEFDTPSKTGAYIAAGLVLFIVTFVVNALARVIADRGGAK